MMSFRVSYCDYDLNCICMAEATRPTRLYSKCLSCLIQFNADYNFREILGTRGSERLVAVAGMGLFIRFIIGWGGVKDLCIGKILFQKLY